MRRLGPKPEHNQRRWERIVRYAVYTLEGGIRTRYGIPFGTLNGAISCVARLFRAGVRATIEEVR